MTDLDDLDGFFDAAPARPVYSIVGGRYKFPAPPGVELPPQGSWMRTTNLASAFSDQKALQEWLEWKEFLGLLAHEGALFDEMAAAGIENWPTDRQREYVKELAARARAAAGADSGAVRGTARHTMLEVYLQTGEVTGHRRMRAQLSSMLEVLDAHGLDFIPGWSERRVCNPRYGVIGTLDCRVRCRRTGQEGVLDLKTQRKFWSYQEAAGQQEAYDSAPWVWEGPEDTRGRWVPAPVNNLMGTAPDTIGRRVALLAHMPQQPGPGQLPVELHEVTLDGGREVMEQAVKIVELRSRGKSVGVGRRMGYVRPDPDRGPIRVAATLGVATRAIAE